MTFSIDPTDSMSSVNIFKNEFNMRMFDKVSMYSATTDAAECRSTQSISTVQVIEKTSQRGWPEGDLEVNLETG